MEDKKKTNDRQTLNEFSTYIKHNPDVSYSDAAHAMHRSPRTIHRWGDKLGVKLTSSFAGEQLPLSPTAEDGMKAATDAAIQRMKEQTSLAEQRLAWEMTNMNKIAEVQRNLAAAEAKTRSQPQSPVDDVSKVVSVVDTIKNMAKDWATDWTVGRPPAPISSSPSYQARNLEEYEKVLDLEYKRSGKQSRDKMIESVISPLKDYLFQRFGSGIPPQQQSMLSQSQPIHSPPHGSSPPQEPQPQMVYVFRLSDQYDVACPFCSAPVTIALGSISVNRCSKCGILVLSVEDSSENAEYIKQMKSGQWTDELTSKIQLAVHRFSESAVQGLRLNTQPLVDKSEDASNDPLMGTFLAVAIREAINKYLVDISTDTVNSLVEKNVGVDTVWKMIPRGFEDSMTVFASEHPKQLRYVLNPTWVVDAIRGANPSLAEYFTDHPTGKAWLNGVILGFRSKLGVA